MNYEQLVKALRCCATDDCGSCPYSIHEFRCATKMGNDAATAIEALQAQLPKRGEIVRCRECRWGTMCVTGQHLGLDGFCSKGEREVQDESAGSL